MKVNINDKERDDIIKIDILNNMIDFETKNDSFYLIFQDIKDGIRVIIEDEKNNKIKELINKFEKDICLKCNNDYFRDDCDHDYDLYWMYLNEIKKVMES